MSTPSIYLDYAAATPMDPRVQAAMEPYFGQQFYNPSASYLAAKAVREAVQEARETVAQCIGAKPSEVIFVAGGTEANNLAIHGVMSQYPDGSIVISSIEHESLRAPAEQYDYREVPVAQNGIVSVKDVVAAIDDTTVLVSVMYANNEVGTVQPLGEIATALQKIKDQRRAAGNPRPLLLHSDACQAGNYLDLHTARLGVDLMTLNGGKIYGPKQSGVLFVKTGVVLEPQIRGGGQERGLRSGTENVAAAIGFAAALVRTQKLRANESKRLAQLRDTFIAQLTTAFPDAWINGSLKKRLPNNVSVTFPGIDNERLMMQLDFAGVMCAVGSACSASSDEPSHVLKALGLSDNEAQATLRFSLGRQTSEKDIKRVMTTLQGMLNGS